MGTILCTYEFGAGLGHLNRLLAIVEPLAKSHRVVFAIPDLKLGTPLIQAKLGTDAEIRPGSSWPAPSDPKSRNVPTHTFADVIRMFGFDNSELLQRNCAYWEAVLKEVRPDLVIADFAPSLRLVTMNKVPTVVVGNGYSVPPAAKPLPPMRPWENVVPSRSRSHEGLLLSAINDIQTLRSAPRIDYFSNLFQGDDTFVCTVAEFDPYRRFRNGPLSWPFNIPKIGLGESFEARSGPAIFVYLQANHPLLLAVLAAVSHVKQRVEVYVQGADPKAIARRCSAMVGVHTRPASFEKVLPQIQVLVHHAGLGTAYAGLVAAVPQVVIPVNLEHLITSVGLHSFGVSERISVNPPATHEQIFDAVQRTLDNPKRKTAALSSAESLRARRVDKPTEPIIQACQRHL